MKDEVNIIVFYKKRGVKNDSFSLIVNDLQATFS